MRSFCYIADAIAGYFKILLDGEPGEAYNVCNSDMFISVKELAQVIISLCPEKNLKVITSERENDEIYLENKAVGFIPPDNSKLKKLGWVCKFNCKEGFGKVLTALDK